MNYRTTTLDTFVTLQRGYDLPSQDRVLGDIPVIAANGRVGFHNISKVETECVVLGRSGSVGNPQLITEPFWPLNTTLYVKDFHGNLPTFVFYVLKTIDFKSFDAGGTVPTLNRNHLTQIQVPIVDSARQEVIGGVLQSLDSKIAANQALTKTLEDIAQTIFKSWFIDFDPVKAKMAAEAPKGIDDETASLFPDSMEDSEFGFAPTGWTHSPLGHHISVTKGKSYKSSELSHSETALVTLKSFMRGGGYRFDGLKAFSGPFKPEQVIEPGELVVSFTDVTQAADVIGKPAIVLGNPRFSTLVASLDVGIVRATSKRVGRFFLYQLFLSSQFNSHIAGFTNGTTVLHLGKGALEDFVFPLPSERLIEKFEEIARPLWLQVQALYLENILLEEIRDSLLPRLISGELVIPEDMMAS